MVVAWRVERMLFDFGAGAPPEVGARLKVDMVALVSEVYVGWEVGLLCEENVRKATGPSIILVCCWVGCLTNNVVRN